MRPLIIWRALFTPNPPPVTPCSPHKLSLARCTRQQIHLRSATYSHILRVVVGDTYILWRLRWSRSTSTPSSPQPRSASGGRAARLRSGEVELATFCILVIRVIVNMKIIMSIKIRRGGVEPATMSTPHPLLAPPAPQARGCQSAGAGGGLPSGPAGPLLLLLLQASAL